MTIAVTAMADSSSAEDAPDGRFSSRVGARDRAKRPMAPVAATANRTPSAHGSSIRISIAKTASASSTPPRPREKVGARRVMGAGPYLAARVRSTPGWLPGVTVAQGALDRGVAAPSADSDEALVAL